MLLGWKKDSGGYLLPDTKRGETVELTQWLPIDKIAAIAKDHINQPSNAINKIDIRPDKGVAKVIFEKNNLGVQVDGKTGKVLQEATRRSDWLEDVHDGSIVDEWMGWKGVNFKLIYTSIMGLALLTFCLTGFWLWYGPKKMRQEARV